MGARPLRSLRHGAGGVGAEVEGTGDGRRYMNPWQVMGHPALALRRVPGVMAMWVNLKGQVQPHRERAE